MVNKDKILSVGELVVEIFSKKRASNFMILAGNILARIRVVHLQFLLIQLESLVSKVVL
jgi:hypothetical protein